MAYLDKKESELRVNKVREILKKKDIDIALVYYDEFNIGNGWYLTGWCPQFESGVVMVPREGKPMILGGPESEPFAKLDSAITETRNLPVFMVPDEEYPNATIIDFPELFKEISKDKPIRSVGIAGMDRMPLGVYRQMEKSFTGVKMLDITSEYVELRYIKSKWEITQIRKAFEITDSAYKAMVKKVKPGAYEYEVAAVGESVARALGASGLGFGTIVGSGPRSNAVVPTARDRKMKKGEFVMVGISPRWKGYCGVTGNTLVVGSKPTVKQKECLKHLSEALRLTRSKLVPGNIGKEIDAPARAYFNKVSYLKYLVCPFCHTIGVHEAESPFFGPHSKDELKPGMTVCIDVSFFGHPEFNGVRIETGYEITEKGLVPMSPYMDKLLCLMAR